MPNNCVDNLICEKQWVKVHPLVEIGQNVTIIFTTTRDI
jgi:hypothetical protein